MEDTALRTRILLSTQRALLGRISRNIRMITIDWDKNYFELKAYYDKIVTEDDIENLEEITTEIAADFPEMEEIEELYEYSLEEISDLIALKEVVYKRKE